MKNMKKIVLAISSLLIILSFSYNYAQDKKDSKDVQKTEIKNSGSKTTDVKTAGKFVNKTCIVSHEEIDSKFSAEYKGKTYAFCCNTCLKKFNKDPEKYVAKFEKENSKKTAN
jgi:YHS domain-containing protein